MQDLINDLETKTAKTEKSLTLPSIQYGKQPRS